MTRLLHPNPVVAVWDRPNGTTLVFRADGSHEVRTIPPEVTATRPCHCADDIGPCPACAEDAQ